MHQIGMISDCFQNPSVLCWQLRCLNLDAVDWIPAGNNAIALYASFRIPALLKSAFAIAWIAPEIICPEVFPHKERVVKQFPDEKTRRAQSATYVLGVTLFMMAVERLVPMENGDTFFWIGLGLAVICTGVLWIVNE